MDALDEMRVYVRNLMTNEWVAFAPGEWIDQYESRVFDAIAMYGATFGGTLSLTGTPEHGRVTVYASPLGEVILDYDWFTWKASEVPPTIQLKSPASEPAQQQQQQPPAGV